MVLFFSSGIGYVFLIEKPIECSLKSQMSVFRLFNEHSIGFSMSVFWLFNEPFFEKYLADFVTEEEHHSGKL